MIQFVTIILFNNHGGAASQPTAIQNQSHETNYPLLYHSPYRFLHHRLIARPILPLKQNHMKKIIILQVSESKWNIVVTENDSMYVASRNISLPLATIRSYYYSKQFGFPPIQYKPLGVLLGDPTLEVTG